MILLDGKALFLKIKSELTLEVQNLCRSNLSPPHLSAILVGDNPASQTYVNAKIKACKEIGFQSSVFQYSKDVSQDVLIKKIQHINNANHIDGLIVQLPLPKHIDADLVTTTL